MTLAQLQAVSCPNCGVGLKVLGGGRVVMHICSHCGTQLDAIDNYRKLKTFANLARPATPFAIGAKGVILGVEWTVIGILGQTERFGGRVWTWVDHQLYSPTHGYAWLTLDQGHLTLTRRYRGDMRPGWLTVATVESAESRPIVHADGVRYAYYETSDSEISFAEGEFTWVVGVGDKTNTIDLLGDDAMLSLSTSGTEREVDRTIYLPQAETCTAFGVAPLSPWKVHPLQPLKRSRNAGFLTGLGMAGAGVCLFLSLIFWGMQGQMVLPRQSLAHQNMPAEVTFEINDLHGLATINLAADVNNSWAWLEATLTDPAGAPVFTVGREVDFYDGTDAEGYWSEGNRTATIRFHPELAGEYTLELDVPEGGLDTDTSGARLSAVTVSAQNGGSTPAWTLLAALVFAGIAGFQFAKAHLHTKARWAGSDWSDED